MRYINSLLTLTLTFSNWVFFRSGLILNSYSSCCSCSCWGDLFKNPRLRRFKSNRVEIWQECSSRKYASIGRFLIWPILGRHFPAAAVESAPMAMWCTYLVSVQSRRRDGRKRRRRRWVDLVWSRCQRLLSCTRLTSSPKTCWTTVLHHLYVSVIASVDVL